MSDKVKKESIHTDDAPRCPSCRLPITDGLWLLCPRCRAPLSACGGCVDCGKCGKNSR